MRYRLFVSWTQTRNLITTVESKKSAVINVSEQVFQADDFLIQLKRRVMEWHCPDAVSFSFINVSVLEKWKV